MTPSLRIGLACTAIGLLAGIAIGWVIRGTDDVAATRVEQVAESPAITRPTVPLDNRSKMGSPNKASSDTDSKPRALRDEPAGSIASASEIEGIATQETSSNVAPRAIPVSEAHEAIIGRQFRPDEETGEKRAVRDILEAEAVDDSWSYFMTQTLQLFISGHSEANKFSIFHIECRTTMCEVQALGFDESTSPDWSRILYDMSLEPWYEFTGSGTHNDNYEGQLVILTRLFRREQIEAE